MASLIAQYPALECELVTEFTRLENIAAEWHGLWMASRSREPFQSFGWARAFWKVFGPQLSLCTPVVYRGSKVIGIVPLVLAGDSLQFLGTPFTDYNDVICSDECVGEVLSAAVGGLLSFQEHWKSAVLDNVRAEGRIMRQIRQLGPPVALRFRAAFKSPCFATVANPGGGDMLLKLSKKDHLRAHENKLRRQGQLTFKHLERKDEILQALAGFFQQHIERYAMRGETSMFRLTQNRRFFEALVEELDPRALLRFGVLSLNDRPIASHFGFETNRKFIHYQSAFDINYWSCSPGEALLRNLLRYAHEEKISEFDFTTGGEQYKKRFANTRTENVTVYFNADRRVRHHLYVNIRRANGALLKARDNLRGYPRVYDFLKSVVLQSRTIWRCELHSVRCAGPARYGADVLHRAVRNLIFAWDRLAWFSIHNNLSLQPGADFNRFSITTASLRELAVISLDQPRIASELQRLQKRLVAGDEFHIVRDGSELAQIWVVGKQGDLIQQAGEVGSPLTLQLYWTAPDLRSRSFLGELVERICRRHKDVLLCCSQDDETAQELVRLQMRPVLQVHRLRILHYFKRSFHRRFEDRAHTVTSWSADSPESDVAER